MKKQFITVSLLALVVSGAFTGCKSDSDTTAPVIILTGANPFNLEMLTTYTDPGATAQDDKDGNVSLKIVTDASDVVKEVPGSYLVYYSVSDAAGNATSLTRDVVVYASPAALARNYSVKDSCGTGAALQIYNYSQSPAAFSSTQIKFNKFADYSGNTNIVATINTNGTITLALQQANGIGSLSENHSFQGTGMVTPTGFYLEYTDTNLSQGNASTTCKAHFSRI